MTIICMNWGELLQNTKTLFPHYSSFVLPNIRSHCYNVDRNMETFSVLNIFFVGSLRKPQGLMNRTMAVHVRYNSCYISQVGRALQNNVKFCVGCLEN